MKKNMKKAMRIALALCMAVAVFLGGVSEVHAAKWKKSFTKNINMNGGMLMITIDVKEETTLTVTTSGKITEEGGIIQPKMYDKDGMMEFKELKKGKKSVKFKVTVPKGQQTLYVEKHCNKDVKLKIKVSAKKKVVAYISKTIEQDVG